MADLDTLRPEVAAAVLSIDMDGVHYIDGYAPEKEWPMVRAELLRLANKNRVLELKNRGTLANNLCPDHRDKQVGRPCLACLIEKAEAELVDLKVKYTRLNEVCENTVRCLREQDDEADRNEAELAALKDKIADAPITQVTRMAAIGGGGYEWAGCRVPDAWNGKRVRLVVEE